MDNYVCVLGSFSVVRQKDTEQSRRCRWVVGNEEECSGCQGRAGAVVCSGRRGRAVAVAAARVAAYLMYSLDISSYSVDIPPFECGICGMSNASNAALSDSCDGGSSSGRNILTLECQNGYILRAAVRTAGPVLARSNSYAAEGVNQLLER